MGEHDYILKFDYFHLALDFFMIVSLLLIGFFLAAMLNMRKLVAAPRAWRLIISGRILNSLFLVWVAYQASKREFGTITWEYWLVVSGAIITLIGLIDAMRSYQKIPYGRRWSDKNPPFRRRRDDKPFPKESKA